MPSLIRPKKGGSGVASGTEVMDVLIDREDRGEERRRVESIELLGVGVRVELFDRARRGKENCCGGVTGGLLDADLIIGDVVGDDCWGD